MIRVDAQVGRDGERLLDDVARAEGAVVYERLGGALRERAARADRQDAALGLEHVAHAGDDQRVLAVGHREHRLQAAQDPVGAPVLGELHRRAQQVALVLVELRLEALEQRESVGGAAGEAGEDAVLVEAAHLLGAALDDDVAERHLAVAAERDRSIAPDRKNGGAVQLFHGGQWYQAGCRGRSKMNDGTASSVIVHTTSGPAGKSNAMDSSSPAR